MRVSFPKAGLANLPKVAAVLILLLATAVPANNPIQQIGGEGGWINVPGGGGGTRPMYVARVFSCGGTPYVLLIDPVTPSGMVASFTTVVAWATGNQSLTPPKYLESKYWTTINGKPSEITVHVDCQSWTAAKCAQELEKLVRATQAELPPIPPPK